ncbi:hypothetical protein [Pseudoalteromonas byunsanensis]|uniref:4Fe4S-binding SPASM domain-containing protein n=1 Tax=Pseudoalteromonas byunsanensis TaxID=327939 RepID=A0A1S1NE93_9GAMM|nr:hypothetical protein [Pseudoalteromonas byunsanensis]OHU96673.1 hypothetical protein BIW53_04930 [Pseudoalteromonas byunsanensis]
MRMINNPAVTWCKGYKNALLMHLHDEKVQSVPQSVLEVIEYIADSQSTNYQDVLIRFSEHADVVKGYLDFLLQKKWLLEVPDFVEYQPISIKPSAILKIRNFYLEVCDSTSLDWFEDIARWLRKHRATHSLIVRLYDESEKTQSNASNIIKCARHLGYNQCGILFSQHIENKNAYDGMSDNLDFFLAQQNDAHKTHIHGVEVIKLTKDIVHKGSHLQSNLYSCRHNKLGTYRADNIFIDKNKAIYPHPFDLYFFGKANNSSYLSQVIDSPKAHSYFFMSKDKIDKCRICEYRLSCTNSLWNRQDKHILSSAPNNCTYDPVQGLWHDMPVTNTACNLEA